MTNSWFRRALPAIALLAAQASWAQAPAFTINAFKVEGAQLVPDAQLQAMLAPFTGPNRSMDDIQRAVVAVKAAYAAAGYPIVQVFPPEQTVSNGTVVLRVSEGKVAKITVSGLKAYSEGNIRASLPPLQEGSAPNTAQIVAAVALANENPAKQVAINLAPGAQPGAVDARIDVQEDRIGKFGVTLDNAGAPATGRERLGLSAQYANVFDRDHVFNLQFMTSLRHPSDTANLTAGYRIPLYRLGMALDLVAAYSDSKSNVASPNGALFFAGKGSYAGMRLNQTLPSSGAYRHKLIYGLDYKDFKNNCMLGDFPIDNCGTITAIPASLAYAGQGGGPLLQAGFSLSYVRNLQGGPHGSALDYGNRPRAWQALRASAFMAMPMANWQWRATTNVQYTDDVLIPSEQFGIGGAASVRGYDERTVAGDRGALLNVELYTPELAPRFKLRALAFYDVGIVRSNDAMLSGSTHLGSVGLGLRASIGNDFSLRIDGGSAQVATGPGASAPRSPNQGFFHVHLSSAF